jgi:excisionase family DNA binding protein
MNFELVTVTEYAKRNNVSRSTTLELIKSGTLDARKVGRSYVVLMRHEALVNQSISIDITNVGTMTNRTFIQVNGSNNQVTNFDPAELERIVKAEVLRVLSGMANLSMN